MNKKQKDNKKAKIDSMVVGTVIGLAIFVFLGIITVLIPNSLFVRMTPVYFYDYIFFVLTSILSGVYVALWHYSRNTNSKRSCMTVGGIVAGFFSFGCAICNKLLILVLGLTTITTYFMPIQPILGVFGLILLSYAIYTQYRKL